MPQPPFCQVYKLVDEGAARQSGKVHEGDMLLCINGRSVQNQTPDDVRKVLSCYTQDTKILLELRRPISSITMNDSLSNEDIPNGHPPTYSSPQSPDEPDIANLSPEGSPKMSGRTRRSPVFGGLPGIQETPVSNNTLSPHSYNPALQDMRAQRHSLTPDATRRVKQMSLKPAKSLDLANLPQWRQHTTLQVPLRNLITETDTHDRLHNQGVKVMDYVTVVVSVCACVVVCVCVCVCVCVQWCVYVCVGVCMHVLQPFPRRVKDCCANLVVFETPSVSRIGSGWSLVPLCAFCTEPNAIWGSLGTYTSVRH